MFTACPDSSRPAAYQRIYQLLLREIQRGHLAGDLLPSENELAKRFNVNRHTVRRATDELVRNGIVRKKRGFGTEIVDPALTYPLQRAMRFTASLESLDLSVASILLSKSIEQADEHLSHELGLLHAREVVHLQMLRIVEEWPFLISDVYFPAQRFAAFIDEFSGGSMYVFFRKHFGFTPLRRRSLVSAIAANPDDAQHLRVPPGSPLLRVRALNIHPIEQQPVEYSVIRFRSDRIQLEITS